MTTEVATVKKSYTKGEGLTFNVRTFKCRALLFRRNLNAI